MSRKNIFGISDTPIDEDMSLSAPTAPAGTSLRDDRPIAGLVPAVRNGAPVGGISKTLGSITTKIERADALERQLAEGQAIVELDPTLIDSSFVSDRLAIDPAELQSLVEQMRGHGQQVPILVRPHPDAVGRFQLAYGHRRVAAAKILERTVKAVVRILTDDELVVSQGQENNSRTDLSYIERCLFAARLEDGGFSRDVVIAALGVDKTNVSRMIALVRQIPTDLILAIGAAPAIGRRRWSELAEKLPAGNLLSKAAEIVNEEAVRALSSDARFDTLFARLNASDVRQPSAWQRFEDAPPVKFKRSSSGTTFVFNEKEAPGFDEFVKRKLCALYEEYRKTTGE